MRTRMLATPNVAPRLGWSTHHGRSASMRHGSNALLQRRVLGTALFAGTIFGAASPVMVRAQEEPVPMDERGTADAERSGVLDAGNVRTLFWNYGMVGDYPADPGNVDLSVFHSCEAPKGSGMNYSDGITPFVLAKVRQRGGTDAYIMETGYRERQGTSPYFNRVMRFEPRPGYFQADPSINEGRSPAVSNDPRTWPDAWPDKRNDLDDPGWSGSWNGYFGKQQVSDLETYSVMDDQYYDAWDYYPDSRDETRRGLGLRIEVRGFQWANPQAQNVIFWHYDVTNESDTDYDDNMIFGLYMDSGVGGSALSCRGVFESDDDNAYFDRTFDNEVLNLVYTWDNDGIGVDLSSNCSPTGYLGYAYLETPGDPFDGSDNDEDGIIDEVRNGGPGVRIDGQDAIRAYVAANYDESDFISTYGELADRPPFRNGVWWTGDEDMDWVEELHDVGADGLADTGDTGEGDGMPTAGEPNFDQTDLNESDQIGLTGFKINRIRPGQGNPDQETDGIVFFTDNQDWPERLYEQFSDADSLVRFGDPLGSNYNIGFLFASGPFSLEAGQTERFSLALAYGADLGQLRRNVQTVQKIYDANYRFAVPPPAPDMTAEAGDGFVRLSWTDISEHAADPVTGEFDFEGYRIYRSTDPNFLDPKVVTTGTGSGTIGNGRPIMQFDLDNDINGFSDDTVEGVAYYLGEDTGLTHTWVDSTVTNGQEYYYGIAAYDSGSEEFGFYPSENALAVSRTPRGGFVFPVNAVAARPNPRVDGFVAADANGVTHSQGRGVGTVDVDVVNSDIVPDGHVFQIDFHSAAPESVRATRYSLTDLTTGEVLFEKGTDLSGSGIGPVGAGLLPIVSTPRFTQPSPTETGFTDDSSTNAVLKVEYLSSPRTPVTLVRPGYPEDITVEFYDDYVDTSIVSFPFRATPAKFRIIAHGAEGDHQMNFRFRDTDVDGTISAATDIVDIVTYREASPDTAWATWRLVLDVDAVEGDTLMPPRAGDQFELEVDVPFRDGEAFVFDTIGASVDPDLAAADFKGTAPYVVPNPYVGSASFEPQRFAESGRGTRRIEFRALPRNSTVRIYTVRGRLVQTLQHDGSNEGFVAWDLRTKDNLDVAPGLYIYHVDGPDIGTYVGKFAIIK
ncbi:MAG: T9SS type A sorting domain-containing protein [Candidatus Eisenbacteria bacterium]|uniref:T9SS type A sorting domain-containing protein n=1 Tax=Eiseniibacteriota bacterium TaxID=2212470 RepID=A0A956NC11_UNCEI|nr:T9SS type A sorting domain-containing protein [Candidatus Eisenbacteria bacterium]